MAKIGIFYGSATGTTADIARRLGNALGVADADIHDVATTAPHVLGQYDLILLGSSTHGNGRMEDDWYDFVDGAQSLDLSGRQGAIFGCGDETMTDTFCDAVGVLYERFRPTGLALIGEFNADGYHFGHSEASDGSLMRGLVLDEVNHPELTDGRIAEWVKELRRSM